MGMVKENESLLSPRRERRHAEYFDVVNASLNIKTPQDFCAWAKGDLQHIFPHGMLICGIGQLGKNSAHIHKMLTCRFPREYLDDLQQLGGMGSSPVVLQWLKTRKPVLFEMAQQKADTPWLDNFRRYGLQNMAAHGMCDIDGNTTSYFCFTQIPSQLNLRHAKLLEMLTPHLHVALTRVLRNTVETPPIQQQMATSLTVREQQIFSCIKSGKSNWQIAQELNISENTVKNHVQRILTKLNVNTRAQAIAKIMQG